MFLATEIQRAINLKLNSVHKYPVITGVTKNDTQQGNLYRNRHIIFTHYFMYTRLSIKYLIKINQSLILLILLKHSVIYTVTGKESWYYCVDPGPVKKKLWFCDSCCAALNKLIAQQQQQIYLGSIIQRGVSKVCIGKDKRWSDWLLDFALGNPKFWQRGNVTTNHNWFQAQVTIKEKTHHQQLWYVL